MKDPQRTLPVGIAARFRCHGIPHDHFPPDVFCMVLEASSSLAQIEKGVASLISIKVVPFEGATTRSFGRESLCHRSHR